MAQHRRTMRALRRVAVRAASEGAATAASRPTLTVRDLPDNVTSLDEARARRDAGRTADIAG